MEKKKSMSPSWHSVAAASSSLELKASMLSATPAMHTATPGLDAIETPRAAMPKPQPISAGTASAPP